MAKWVKITGNCRHPLNAIIKVPDSYGDALVMRGMAVEVNRDTPAEVLLAVEEEESRQAPEAEAETEAEPASEPAPDSGKKRRKRGRPRKQ